MALWISGATAFTAAELSRRPRDIREGVGRVLAVAELCMYPADHGFFRSDSAEALLRATAFAPEPVQNKEIRT